METIRDRIIREKSYIIEIPITSQLHLFIECLNGNNEAINEDFNEGNITDNILVELHDKQDIIMELFDIDIDTKICFLNEIVLNNVVLEYIKRL